MQVIVDAFDYERNWKSDTALLWTVSTTGGLLLYFSISCFCYYFYYNKKLLTHKKFLKNQINREIRLAMLQIPIAPLLMMPFWLAELNGYSKIYTRMDSYSYFALSIVMFLAFSDFTIYWIHRIFHHPLLYSWLHKPHHTWKISTPFSAFAFHPLDGFGQSLPYHVFPFIFPMQAHLYLVLFVGVQVWTFMIHDNAFLTANNYVNGAAHHAIHHLEFNYNYGQYTTFWDRVFGTHRFPGNREKVNEYFDKAFALGPGQPKNMSQTPVTNAVLSSAGTLESKEQGLVQRLKRLLFFHVDSIVGLGEVVAEISKAAPMEWKK